MRLPRRWNFLRLVALSLAFSGWASGQTASTGALTGVTLDPSGAVLPGVILHLKNEDGSEAKSATSDKKGRFAFLLLSPGTYELQASKADFQICRVRGKSMSMSRRPFGWMFILNWQRVLSACRCRRIL